MNISFSARTERYARGVLAGDVVACKFVKAACLRHLDDLDRSATDADWSYYFDGPAAERICQFIELLPHIKGEWAKPSFVDGRLQYPKIRLEDWQIFFLTMLFGWLNRATGLRRFRRGYLEVARKNAKSTVAAGIALYMLGADGEPGAEVYSAATKKDQAKIVWEVAQAMIQKENEFRELGIEENKSAIYNEETHSKFQPLARDYGSLDGLNTHCFVSDELHAQKDRGLYDVLDSSTGARSQPLGVGITTAGSDRAGVCHEQRSYVIKILNATLLKHDGLGHRVEGAATEDDTYFGIIYTLDSGYADGRPDDDWADPAVWIKANPNLGVSVRLDDIEAACRKAKSMASAQNEFRTKRCNQWVNADTAWMDMAAWNACADSDLTEDEFAGEECCIGLDAAFKTDVFAKVKVFAREGHYYAFGAYYVPDRMVQLKGNDHLAGWAADGRIKVTPGEVVDIEVIKDDLRRDSALHSMREVPYDPAQLTQFASEMLDEQMPMVEMRPLVLNFSEPMKKLEELVLQRKFHHNDDPVLEWMVSNVVCHRDAKDNIYPRKEKPENKIDGVIALVMALGRITKGEASMHIIPDDYTLLVA